MSLRSLKDFYTAMDDGRYHTQRFYKAANGGVNLHWFDWSYAAGQPAYDARIGDALTFTPVTATKNDAVWFPSIPSGMDRHLANINIISRASSTAQTMSNLILYDLVGYYPLIDGDSTDEQLMDNTSSLPRYATGEGLVAVIVNHVAPMTEACNGTMTYINSNGETKTTDTRIALTGQNRICTALPTAGALGAINMPLCSGCKGIRSVRSVTFTTPPGGLFSIYILKLITTVTNNDGTALGEGVFTDKCLCMHNGWNLPKILDGANLGFFFLTQGTTARTNILFGDLTFVWG